MILRNQFSLGQLSLRAEVKSKLEPLKKGIMFPLRFEQSGESWVILKLLDFDVISNFKSQHCHVRNYHIKFGIMLKTIKQAF